MTTERNQHLSPNLFPSRGCAAVFLALFAVGTLIPVVAAQHFPSDKDLTALIKPLVEAGGKGIVVGVMEADESTRIVAYGEAGPNSRPLGSKSLFGIGSVTKVFTGTLLADMVARGEVSLSDAVADYLPDGVSMPSRGGQEITLLDLSTHHSGLPKMPENFVPGDPSNPYAHFTVENLYEFLSSYELTRDIGSEFEYSNVGVGLLGHVLARVAGGRYEEVVRDRILEPLGMNMTGITLEGDQRDWMAEGHDQQGNVEQLYDIPDAFAGAGALRSNAEDLLIFIAANTGPPKSRLEESMRNAHETRKSGSGSNMYIGLNWLVGEARDEKMVFHDGVSGGFQCFIGFDPNHGVGAVVLINSESVSTQRLGMHLINPTRFPWR